MIVFEHNDEHRKEKPSSKPSCEHGTECYRENFHHFDAEQHPADHRYHATYTAEKTRMSGGGGGGGQRAGRGEFVAGNQVHTTAASATQMAARADNDSGGVGDLFGQQGGVGANVVSLANLGAGAGASHGRRQLPAWMNSKQAGDNSARSNSNPNNRNTHNAAAVNTQSAAAAAGGNASHRRRFVDGSWQPPKKKMARECSKCHKPGHTKSRCPALSAVIVIDSDESNDDDDDGDNRYGDSGSSGMDQYSDTEGSPPPTASPPTALFGRNGSTLTSAAGAAGSAAAGRAAVGSNVTRVKRKPRSRAAGAQARATNQANVRAVGGGGADTVGGGSGATGAAAAAGVGAARVAGAAGAAGAAGDAGGAAAAVDPAFPDGTDPSSTWIPSDGILSRSVLNRSTPLKAGRRDFSISGHEYNKRYAVAWGVQSSGESKKKLAGKLTGMQDRVFGDQARKHYARQQPGSRVSPISAPSSDDRAKRLQRAGEQRKAMLAAAENRRNGGASQPAASRARTRVRGAGATADGGSASNAGNAGASAANTIVIDSSTDENEDEEDEAEDATTDEDILSPTVDEDILSPTVDNGSGERKSSSSSSSSSQRNGGMSSSSSSRESGHSFSIGSGHWSMPVPDDSQTLPISEGLHNPNSKSKHRSSASASTSASASASASSGRSSKPRASRVGMQNRLFNDGDDDDSDSDTDDYEEESQESQDLLASEAPTLARFKVHPVHHASLSPQPQFQSFPTPAARPRSTVLQRRRDREALTAATAAVSALTGVSAGVPTSHSHAQNDDSSTDEEGQDAQEHGNDDEDGDEDEDDSPDMAATQAWFDEREQVGAGAGAGASASAGAGAGVGAGAGAGAADMPCPLCNTFFSADAIQMHAAGCDGGGAQVMQECPFQCGKFLLQDHMPAHIASTHSE